MIIIKNYGCESISRTVVETCFHLSYHSTFRVKIHMARFKGKTVTHPIPPFRFDSADITTADILIEPVIIPS